MVEWIPWLLIIVGWHPDTPDNQRVVRVQYVADEAECGLLGEEYIASRKMYREELGPFEYRFFCSPAPDQGSLDEAWKSLIERNEKARKKQ